VLVMIGVTTVRANRRGNFKKIPSSHSQAELSEGGPSGALQAGQLAGQGVAAGEPAALASGLIDRQRLKLLPALSRARVSPAPAGLLTCRASLITARTGVVPAPALGGQD